MNKALVIGWVLGAVVVTAGGAFAGIRLLGAGNSAEVISAKELHKSVKTSRQECHDEQVTHTREPKDTNRLAGTGLGAVVGAPGSRAPRRSAYSSKPWVRRTT